MKWFQLLVGCFMAAIFIGACGNDGLFGRPDEKNHLIIPAATEDDDDDGDSRRDDDDDNRDDTDDDDNDSTAANDDDDDNDVPLAGDNGGAKAPPPVPKGIVGSVDPSGLVVVSKDALPNPDDRIVKVFGEHWGNESKTCNTWCAEVMLPDCTAANLCGMDDIKNARTNANGDIEVDVSTLPKGYMERFFLAYQGKDGQWVYNDFFGLRDANGMLMVDDEGNLNIVVGKDENGQTFACYSPNSGKYYKCVGLKKVWQK